jgi:hypothetical protein
MHPSLQLARFNLCLQHLEVSQLQDGSGATRWNVQWLIVKPLDPLEELGKINTVVPFTDDPSVTLLVIYHQMSFSIDGPGPTSISSLNINRFPSGRVRVAREAICAEWKGINVELQFCAIQVGRRSKVSFCDWNKNRIC